MKISMTHHFISRCIERVPHLRPIAVAKMFRAGIEEGSGAVAYLGRDTRNQSVRRFQMTIDDTEDLCCVVSIPVPNKIIFITIYQNGEDHDCRE